jgi:hypothetical protein
MEKDKMIQHSGVIPTMPWRRPVRANGFQILGAGILSALSLHAQERSAGTDPCPMAPNLIERHLHGPHVHLSPHSRSARLRYWICKRSLTRLLPLAAGPALK